jgi:hypothetical protein
MQNQQPISIEAMVNMVFNFCSFVSMPVEMQLHPFHGTRFYSPLVIAMSTAMMLIVPTFFTFGDNDGLIGMGTIQKWFFVALAAHGIRKFRLMLHPEREKNSYLANDHWFFFNWLPKASFWRIRIVYEPLFLVALSITLQNLLPPFCTFPKPTFAMLSRGSLTAALGFLPCESAGECWYGVLRCWPGLSSANLLP